MAHLRTRKGSPSKQKAGGVEKPRMLMIKESMRKEACRTSSSAHMLGHTCSHACMQGGTCHVLLGRLSPAG